MAVCYSSQFFSEIVYIHVHVRHVQCIIPCWWELADVLSTCTLSASRADCSQESCVLIISAGKLTANGLPLLSHRGELHTVLYTYMIVYTHACCRAH